MCRLCRFTCKLPIELITKKVYTNTCIIGTFFNGEDVGFSFVLNVQLLRQNIYRIPFITVYINICIFCTNKFKAFAHSSRFPRSSESILPNWRALARTRYFLYSSGIGVEMFFIKGWIPAFLGEGYTPLLR